jgi:hypothetical protein
MHPINPEALSRCATILVNHAFTMNFVRLERRAPLCHERGMAKAKPMAGGFFWMAAILIGAVWGVVAGNPMKGILIGTGVGGAIALLIWYLDRSRN